MLHTIKAAKFSDEYAKCYLKRLKKRSNKRVKFARFKWKNMRNWSSGLWLPSIPHLNITKWKLSDDINGHILAFFFLIELILAVIFNFYIIMHSIFFRKRNFTRSSTILLFKLALSDLVMMLFYVLFSVVASSFGE